MTPEIKQPPVPVRHRWVYENGDVGGWWASTWRLPGMFPDKDSVHEHFAGDSLTVELSNGQRINVRAK